MPTASCRRPSASSRPSQSAGDSGSAWHVEGVRVGASIGAAFFPDDGETPEDVLLAADRACFVAKRRGRGHVATASEGLAIASESELSGADAGRPADHRGHRRGHATWCRHHRFRRARHNRALGEVGAVHLINGHLTGTTSIDRPARARRGPRSRARRLPAGGHLAADPMPDRDAAAHADARPDPTPTPPPPTPTPVPTFMLYRSSRATPSRRSRRSSRPTPSRSRTGAASAIPSLDPESRNYAPDRLRSLDAEVHAGAEVRATGGRR